MLAADPAIVEREREARHRAEIAALVSRLVPRPKPATDLLISLALPQPSEQWDTIKVGHSERNIDFWDERALAEAYKKVDQRERLELSRDQVDQVKAIRKALSTASKGVAAELESPALAEPWLFPRSYSEDVVLTRAKESDTPLREPLVDRNVLADLLQWGSFPDHALHSPTEGTTSDSIGEVLDLAFSAPAGAIEALKRKRDALRIYRKKKATEVLLDQADVSEASGASAWASASRARSASPPLFSREQDFARSSGPVTGAIGLSPHSMQQPSSPVFKLDEEWSPRASSPTTSASAGPAILESHVVVTSPPMAPDALPIPTDADFPLFPRTGEAASLTEGLDAKTILLAGLQEHAQGADGELDPAESPTRLIRREMDDLEPCALPFEGDAEMDRAVLPFPLNFKIPVSEPAGPQTSETMMPSLSDFSRAVASQFSLESLSGLRSLTIDLSWRAWKLPDTAESSAVLDDHLITAQDDPQRADDRPCAELISPVASPPSHEEGSDSESIVYVREAPHAGFRSERPRVVQRSETSATLDEVFESGALHVDNLGFTSDSAPVPARATTTAPRIAAVPAVAAAGTGAATCLAEDRARQPGAPEPACLSRPLTKLTKGGSDEVTRSEPSALSSRGLGMFLSLRDKAHAGSHQDEVLRNQPAEIQSRAQQAREQGKVPSHTPCPAIPTLGDRVQHFATDEQSAVPLTPALKVVSLDAFTQMKTHLRLLSQKGVHVVHRSALESTSLDPDIIVDPTSCVVLYRLADLLKSDAMKDAGEAADEASLLRRLEILSAEYERVVVIFEEQDSYVGGRRITSYNPPVMRALEELGAALNRSDPAQGQVKFAFSGSIADTADKIVGFIRQRKVEVAEGIPVLDLWSERPWLTEDPSPGEMQLVSECRLNELAAMAVLAVCSANDFTAMQPDDRQAVFSGILGQRCVERLNQILKHVLPTNVAPSTSPIPTGVYQQLTSIEQQAEQSDETRPSSDSFDWTEFLESLSQ